jgi:hypothetical protein
MNNRLGRPMTITIKIASLFLSFIFFGDYALCGRILLSGSIEEYDLLNPVIQIILTGISEYVWKKLVGPYTIKTTLLKGVYLLVLCLLLLPFGWLIVAVHPSLVR